LWLKLKSSQSQIKKLKELNDELKNVIISLGIGNKGSMFIDQRLKIIELTEILESIGYAEGEQLSNINDKR
jgi:hypothetical protein